MIEWILNLFKKNKKVIEYDSESEYSSGYAEPSDSENSEFSTSELNPLESYLAGEASTSWSDSTSENSDVD